MNLHFPLASMVGERGHPLNMFCQLMSAYLPSPCLPAMQAMVIAVLHARPTSAGVWCGVTSGSGMKFADFIPELEQQAAPENRQISMPKGSRTISS